MRIQNDDNRLTLHDVASEANVSVKTVSRVLNNEPYVSKQKRDQVLNAVKRLDFRPNVQARRLKSKGNRSYQIGLLYDNPTAHYISRLLVGTLERCDEYGYRLIVECLPSEREHPRKAVKPKLLHRNDLDGVILTPPLSDNLNLIKALEGAGHTIIRIVPFADHDRVPYVFMDDIKAARSMTEYLISLGHKRIAHISGDKSHGSAGAREEGFKLAMDAAGLLIEAGSVQSGDYTFKSGRACAEKLLLENNPPTAIFAANDEMAMGVLFGAQAFGIRVPDDLSVAGFDDLPFAAIIEPQLTTIRQPLKEMAEAAAGMLIDLKEGRETPVDGDGQRNLEIQFSLVKRGSTMKLKQ